MAYEPLIDDPEHIRAVDRERYVALRPSTLLRGVHRQLQTLLRQRFAGQPISYPAQTHVTLAGFGAGTPLDAIQAVVESWSRRVSTLRIAVETLTCFPAPSQIVIIRVLKTPELMGALSDLRRDANQAHLVIDTTISLEDWIFHMSVGYCSKLSKPAWNDVTTFVEQLEISPVSCVVSDVEVVAFDEQLEYSGGVYALRATHLNR